MRHATSAGATTRHASAATAVFWPSGLHFSPCPWHALLLPPPRLQYNKGLAFSQLERDRLYLRGLLPPAVLSQEVQAERVLTNIRRCVHAWEGRMHACTHVCMAGHCSSCH